MHLSSHPVRNIAQWSVPSLSWQRPSEPRSRTLSIPLGISWRWGSRRMLLITRGRLLEFHGGPALHHCLGKDSDDPCSSAVQATSRTIYGSDAPFVGERRLLSRLQILYTLDLGASPFCDPAQSARAFSVATISCARTLRGSFGSASSHLFAPNIQITEELITRNVPKKTISKRGGNDFFSGILPGSSTFTLGVSFASCTLASSYCSVSNSYTVS